MKDSEWTSAQKKVVKFNSLKPLPVEHYLSVCKIKSEGQSAKIDSLITKEDAHPEESLQARLMIDINAPVNMYVNIHNEQILPEKLTQKEHKIITFLDTMGVKAINIDEFLS